MASITVRGSTVSPYTLRVLITLRELGVTDFQWAPVDLSKGAHHSPDHLKLQPFGQVPVIQDEDEDLTLFESRVISRYLAQKFEGRGTPLLGKTLKEQALVSQWMEVEAQTYDCALNPILWELVLSPMFGGPSNPQAVAEHMSKFQKALDVYEVHLTKHKYLAGDFFSLADLQHLPNTHIFINVAKQGGVFASRPHLDAWWKDISSRLAFKEVMADSAFMGESL